MLDRIEAILTPARRKWLYRVSWAILSLLGVLGITRQDVAAAILLVAAAILGIADGHTDPSTRDGMPQPIQRQPDVDAPEDGQ